MAHPRSHCRANMRCQNHPRQTGCSRWLPAEHVIRHREERYAVIAGCSSDSFASSWLVVRRLQPHGLPEVAWTYGSRAWLSSHHQLGRTQFAGLDEWLAACRLPTSPISPPKQLNSICRGCLPSASNYTSSNRSFQDPRQWFVPASGFRHTPYSSANPNLIWHSSSLGSRYCKLWRCDTGGAACPSGKSFQLPSFISRSELRICVFINALPSKPPSPRTHKRYNDLLFRPEGTLQWNDEDGLFQARCPNPKLPEVSYGTRPRPMSRPALERLCTFAS